MIKNYLVTGDCHRRVLERLAEIPSCYVPEETALIILGDAGIDWCLDFTDSELKAAIEKTGYTLYLVRGNHDAPPNLVEGLKVKAEENNYNVYLRDSRFPHINYLIDGFIYYFGKFSALVLGGAYSVDSLYRRANGLTWFENEQIGIEERNEIQEGLIDRKVDFVFSHTCPKSFQPIDLFMNSIDQSTVDNSMELWLDYIKEIFEWKYWLFGHYHKDCIQQPCVEQFYYRIDNLIDVANRWETYKFNGKIDKNIPYLGRNYRISERKLGALLEKVNTKGLDNYAVVD